MKIASYLLSIILIQSISSPAQQSSSSYYLVPEGDVYHITEFFNDSIKETDSLAPYTSLHFEYYFDTSDSALYNNQGFLSISKILHIEPKLEKEKFEIRYGMNNELVMLDTLSGLPVSLDFETIDNDTNETPYDSLQAYANEIWPSSDTMNRSELSLFMKVKFERSYLDKQLGGMVMLDKVIAMSDSTRYSFNLLTFDSQNSITDSIEKQIVKRYPHLLKAEFGDKIKLASDSLRAKPISVKTKLPTPRDTSHDFKWLVGLLLFLTAIVLYLLRSMRMI